MFNFNYAGVPVTESAYATQSSAAASAIDNRQMQVVSFSGGASLNSCMVILLLGETEVARLYTKSDNAVGEYYGDCGPIAPTNTSITVRTDVSTGASDWSSANLLYRIVL